MPSDMTKARPWEKDWTSAPKGCTPTAIAWLLAEGRPIPENAPADAAAAGRALFDFAYGLGKDSPPPKPRRPVLWETWDRDVEDAQGTIKAARLRYGMHFSFHPDPDVQPFRMFAVRGLSVGVVKQFARKIVEDVPQGYDPRKHPWWPDRTLRYGMGGCPMCKGNGSRMEQLPKWREIDCPCKAARLDRLVEGLSLDPGTPAPGPEVPEAPPLKAHRSASSRRFPKQPPPRWNNMRPVKPFRPLDSLDVLGPNTYEKK